MGPQVCHYCGVWLTKHKQGRPASRTVDHIVPRARGGPNTKRNLVPCCVACNGLKGPLRSKCSCAWCTAAWATYATGAALSLPVREELPVRDVSAVELALLAEWAGEFRPTHRGGVSRRNKASKTRKTRYADPPDGGSPLSQVWTGHNTGWR